MSSVSASSEDVASSKRIIGLFFKIALAIESLCFSPPDNLVPFSPIIVSYFLGSLFMNSSANENLAASSISSWEASLFAYKILFFIVSSNNVVSWLTREILFLKEKPVEFYIDWSSILISPLSTLKNLGIDSV